MPKPVAHHGWATKKMFEIYNQGQKLYGQLRKMAFSLTPQAMYNQFKRPYAGSIIELYYIYGKT